MLLKTESFLDANFLVNGGTGDCFVITNQLDDATSENKVGIMTTLDFQWFPFFVTEFKKT